MLESAFRAADTNGDRRLSFDEFAGAASAIGLGVAERELRAAFGRFDADGNGEIDFNEIVGFICPELSASSRADKLALRTHRRKEVTVDAYERMVAAQRARERLGLSTEDDAAVEAAVRRVAEVVYEREISERGRRG